MKMTINNITFEGTTTEIIEIYKLIHNNLLYKTTKDISAQISHNMDL